jgi:hypothetical protein
VGSRPWPRSRRTEGERSGVADAHTHEKGDRPGRLAADLSVGPSDSGFSRSHPCLKFKRGAPDFKIGAASLAGRAVAAVRQPREARRAFDSYFTCLISKQVHAPSLGSGYREPSDNETRGVGAEG